MAGQKTILIVDDEPGVVQVIKLHLEKKGYKVFVAHDGEEGLRQAHRIKPGLIILDVNMPKKGGIEFFGDITVSGNQKMFPVLMLTGRTEFESLFKGANADGFIPKPIDFNKLLETVNGIFKKYELEKEKSRITAKNVVIIEDDDETLDRIALVFVRAGFAVRCVKTSGELAAQAPTGGIDLLMVKLALCDAISGVRNVPQLLKKETTVFLYTLDGSDLDKSVAKKLCEEAGVTLGGLLSINNASDLLAKAKEVLGAG